MKIKYEASQQFQIDAIDAVTGIFEGQPANSEYFTNVLKSDSVSGAQEGLFSEIGAIGNNLLLDTDSVLENVQAIQDRNGIESIGKLDGMNFSVEMETGTGKTYVYLRTAFELAKHYNFTKFIIIVPSVAIKEGVKSSIEMMRQHFMDIYAKPFDVNVYDGKNPEVVQSFATSTTLQFMILTIDAIRGNRKLIIRDKRDKLNGIAPLDYLAAANPIVIMDEPQNMETELSTSAIGDLNPMCTLRYSASLRHRPRTPLPPVCERMRHLRTPPLRRPRQTLRHVPTELLQGLCAQLWPVRKLCHAGKRGNPHQHAG